MSSSSSKRWTSAASGTEAPGRSSSQLPPASALSPVRQSARRAASRSEPAATAASSPVTVSIARALWPSSSTGGSKSGKSKAPHPRAPSSPSSPAPPPPPPPPPSSTPSSVTTTTTTLADQLVRDDAARARSCTELPRFADADAEARKLVGNSNKPSGKGAGGGRHTFGRSMRFLPSTKPAGVTLTPGRVAPSDLRRLADADAAADVASSGSECSDASRGSGTAAAPARAKASSKPSSPLLPRTGSVRLLGSSTTQWALSPGRRSGSPPSPLATLPESKGGGGSKKSLISLGWGHIFHRRRHAAEDASLAAVTATLLSSPVAPRSSTSGGGEAGHHMKMAHCRLLQWRFANAKADAVGRRKMAGAELELLGAWASVSEMRGKVARKRTQLDKEKQKIKLNTVLSFQMKGLERWEKLQTEHDSALASTVSCTKAAVCRLPLTNGTKVSLAPLATVLQQAHELTLTAKAVTRSFSPMAQDTALLISKLVRVAREEKAMLQECVELLSQFSALQVEEQSLRSHLVQSAPLSAVVVK